MLFRAALSWFIPLLKKNPFLLKDLDDFLTKFNDTIDETNKVQMATTKICSLRQRSHLTLVYAADFCQLACDVDWDDNAHISVFCRGLQDDVKDLLLNLLDPLTLTKAVTQAVRCDNRLFERRLE